MNLSLKKTLLFTMLMITAQIMMGQYMLFTNTCNAGGNYSQTADYKLSSNIGEMSLVNALVAPEFIITQGVLQPLRTRPAPEIYKGKISARIFPTLITGNQFMLEIKSPDPVKVSIRLISIDGKSMLFRRVVVDAGTTMTNNWVPQLGSGTYFVRIELQNSNETDVLKETFKIIKP